MKKRRRSINKLLLALLFSCFTQQVATGQTLASVSKAMANRQETPAISNTYRPLKEMLRQLETRYHVAFVYESDLVINKLVKNDVRTTEDFSMLLRNLLTAVNLKAEQIQQGLFIISAVDNTKPTATTILGEKTTETDNQATVSNALTLTTVNEKAADPVAVNITVSGRITGDQGEGLPGASVVLKGTTNGTVTNADGQYTLTIPDASANGTLVISYIGYLPKEIALNGRSQLDVSLQPDVQVLNETVVVGYGTQKRSDLTGAVASVKAEEIKNLPVRSVNEAIQGRVAGAVVTQDDGNPRSEANIIVRGPVNIQGRNPLYVVDGIPFIGTGPNFNIQDVESIEVLKDASAAAIYGTLGSGGVILVTTKKGKAGKLRTTFNSIYGLRNVINLPDLLRRDDYIRAKTAFGFDPQSLFGDPANYSQLPDTDWFNELHRQGKEQNYTLSLSGGSEKSTFYLSGNYNRIDGVRIDNSLERYTLRLNSDHRINKRVKIGQTLYGVILDENPANPSNQGYLSFRSTPLMPVYDATNPIGGWGKTPPGFNGGNDVGGELSSYRRMNDYELNLSTYLDVMIIDGLNFRTNLAYGQSGREEYYYNYLADFGITGNRDETFGKFFNKSRNFLGNAILTYTKTIGTHDFSVMAGYEARKGNYSDLRGDNRSPFVERPQNFGLVKQDTLARPGGGYSEGDRYLSQFGRINYTFKNKYLLTANFRRDGSALKFGPNYKYGFFPSASAGWKISEEPFMRNVPVISSLKLRGGYGVLGNEPNDAYLFTTGYGIGGNVGFVYDFGGGRRIGVSGEPRLANPDVRWETVATANVGIDGALWQNKFSFTIDAYSRQTKDMLYDVPLAASAGVGRSVKYNIGQMSNKGVEVLLDYRNKLGDFTYGITFNTSYNKNKLISLDASLGKQELRDGGTNQAYGYSQVSKSEPGQPLGQFYGYIVDGIYQDESNAADRPKIAASSNYIPKAGDLIYRDLNQDGVINDNDKTYIGNPWPKFNHGLNLNLGYKGFDLSAFFNAVQGMDIYNAAQTYRYTFYGDYNTTRAIFGASNFNGNGVTGIPNVGTAGQANQNGNWTFISSYHVQNGNYVKLRNLQLGYTLPEALVSKVNISSVRVFLMGNNLFILTKYKGLDPELSGIAADPNRPRGTNGSVRAQGVDADFNRYPVSRLFSLGLNAEF